MYTNSKRKFINVNFTISYEEHAQGFIMPEFHFHNDYEIYILLYGERTISIEGAKDFLTIPGDAVFFAREELHKSRGDTPFAGICIHFSQRFLRKYFTEDAITKFLQILENRKFAISQSDISLLRQMTEEFLIEDECNFIHLARIIDILYQNIPRKSIIDSMASKTSESSKSTEIFAYVDENYAHIKELREISDLFQISESYLFKLFRNKYGMTPKTYINKLKIKNICHSMKYSQATLKSLAMAYGFESYEHFCRVFKKEMKCTPTEYRESAITY